MVGGDAGAGNEAGLRGCKTDGTTFAGGSGVIVMGEALAGPGLGAAVVEGVVRSTDDVADEEETVPPPFPREKKSLSVERNGMLFCVAVTGGCRRG